MEELRWRCQQQEEDERRHDLHHELMTNDGLERAPANRLEQPPTDKEEARQTKQEKNAIVSYEGVSQTEMANMGIDDENHRESPHSVNIGYASLLVHHASTSS